MIALVWLLLAMAFVAAATAWSLRALEGSARPALVAVLGAMAAAFNVIVPIPSVEATTAVVVCASIALGMRTGVAAGILSVVASSVAGGIGVWSVWQAVAVVAVAGLGAAVGAMRAGDEWSSRCSLLLLAATTAAAAAMWDVIVTVGSVASIGGSVSGAPLDQAASLLLLGAAFTATHAAVAAAFAVAGGPPLLSALARARPRLDGGTIAPRPAP